MDDENNTGLLTIITDIFATNFRLVCELTELAKLESKLAGKSLLKIIALSFIIGTFITSTWACIMALIIYYLHLHFSWPLTLTIAILFNLSGLILIMTLIIKYKNNLFFPALRRQLSGKIERIREVTVHEQS